MRPLTATRSRAATRRVHIDTRTDNWSYQFEPGSVYRGNATTNTLMLFPVSQGLGLHACPFCTNQRAGEPAFNELRLEGNPFNHAHLLIVDDQGRRIGYVANRFINEFEVATAVRPRAGAQSRQEPIYRSQTESPLFSIGLVGASKAYRIGVKALSLRANSLLTSQNDRVRGTLAFSDSGAGTQTFRVVLTAYLGGKVKELAAREIQLASNQKAVVQYGSIQPGHTTIPITVE